MKNAVILPYYKAFQQDLGQIYPKNQIFTMAHTRRQGFLLFWGQLSTSRQKKGNSRHFSAFWVCRWYDYVGKKRIRGIFSMDMKQHKEDITRPTEQTISRFDHCPCFQGRRRLLAIEPICWFCKYAGIDLKSDKLPESGICYYPKK